MAWLCLLLIVSQVFTCVLTVDDLVVFAVDIVSQVLTCVLMTWLYLLLI